MNKLKNTIKKIPFLFNLLIRLKTIKTTGTIFINVLPQKEKINVLLDYAKKFNCKIFIETGTYKGDTLFSCKNYFEELFSIELSHELFLYCKDRFLNENKIHIYEGNSGEVLPNIIKKDSRPILFWLDAHYSRGDTTTGDDHSPIVKELDFILSNIENFCILIDDARDFNGKNGYPTMSFLKRLIKNVNTKNNWDLIITVKNDIIRIHKKI